MKLEINEVEQYRLLALLTQSLGGNLALMDEYKKEGRENLSQSFERSSNDIKQLIFKIQKATNEPDTKDDEPNLHDTYFCTCESCRAFSRLKEEN